MKKLNLWIVLSLLSSYAIAGCAFYFGKDIAILSQYSKLMVIAAGVQSVFVLLNLMHSSYAFRLGATLASFCLVPSNYLLLIGFAKLQDKLGNIKQNERAVESFKLSNKLIIGTSILNAIFFIVCMLFISNPFFKFIALGFISLGFIDAYYRSKYAVVKFHKSSLSLKYSPFKATKVVHYSRVQQVRQVNKSIIALIEFVNNKPVTHVIAHAGDLQSRKIKNLPIQTILAKAIKPTHTMADIEQPLASNEV